MFNYIKSLKKYVIWIESENAEATSALIDY